MSLSEILTLQRYSKGVELDLWQAASGNLNARHESETAEQKELNRQTFEYEEDSFLLYLQEIKY